MNESEFVLLGNREIRIILHLAKNNSTCVLLCTTQDSGFKIKEN